MTTRRELAELIGSGLAGWLQLRNAEGTAALHGEESARLALTQILRAQASWRVAIAQQPLNWTNTKKRVDLALVPWADSVNTWYGVVEVKWPGADFDRQKTRLDIVQDAVRVVNVTTSNLNACFVVLGCRADVEAELFDNQHPQSATANDQREAFASLFRRNPQNPDGTLAVDVLKTHFPDFEARVPTPGSVNHAVDTTLLACAPAVLGATTVGRVFVWQCNQRQGRPRP